MNKDSDIEEEDALSAEYVLGLMSDDEARAFEDVMAVAPDLRDRYAFWAENLATLTDGVPAVEPPDYVFKAVTLDLFGAPTSETPPVVAQGRSWLQRLGLLPAVAGGLLAALAVLWVIDATMTDAPADSAIPQMTAQIVAEDQSLIVQASYLAEENLLILDRMAGGARDGRVLEVWLLAGDAPPVSLGVLPEENQIGVALDDTLAAVLDGAILAISDEPPGGSPTGAPTGDVVATGAVTRM